MRPKAKSAPATGDRPSNPVRPKAKSAPDAARAIRFGRAHKKSFSLKPGHDREAVTAKKLLENVSQKTMDAYTKLIKDIAAIKVGSGKVLLNGSQVPAGRVTTFRAKKTDADFFVMLGEKQPMIPNADPFESMSAVKKISKKVQVLFHNFVVENSHDILAAMTKIMPGVQYTEVSYSSKLGQVEGKRLRLFYKARILRDRKWRCSPETMETIDVNDRVVDMAKKRGSMGITCFPTSHYTTKVDVTKEASASRNRTQKSVTNWADAVEAADTTKHTISFHLRTFTISFKHDGRIVPVRFLDLSIPAQGDTLYEKHRHEKPSAVGDGIYAVPSSYRRDLAKMQIEFLEKNGRWTKASEVKKKLQNDLKSTVKMSPVSSSRRRNTL